MAEEMRQLPEQLSLYAPADRDVLRNTVPQRKINHVSDRIRIQDRTAEQLSLYQKQAQKFVENILDVDRVDRDVRENVRANYIFATLCDSSPENSIGSPDTAELSA